MIKTNYIITQHLKTLIPQRYHQKSAVDDQVGDDVVESLLAIKKYRSAKYDSKNSGHFGLKLSEYTHFTSPIRRYFDVIIHRILAGYQFDPTSLNNILEHINEREILVDNLGRWYRKWKILDYLERNKTQSAEIIQIHPNGYQFFIRSLMFDGFFYSKNKLNAGDKVNIELESVDWIRGEPKFILKLN